MHPLDSSFLKFHWANKYFQVVNDVMKRFLDRNPYGIIDNTETNGNTRERVLRLQQFEDIPADVPLLIGDICNNLRSALDHLIWQLWILQYPTFDEAVYFPICDCERMFQSSNPRNIGPRKIKQIRNATVSLTSGQRTLIESLQPYKTGNPALSFLRDINTSDKHRLIQVIGLIGDVNKLRITTKTTHALLQIPLPNTMPIQIIHNTKIEHNAILTRIPLNSFSRGTEVQVQSFGTINFAFQGCKTADGQIIYNSIEAMLTEVKRIIVCFESEFTKFGVSKFK